MEIILPCLACGKELKDVGFGSPNHASGANEFCTHGQYGSTVFDPLNGSRLAINICDQCLIKAAENGLVATGNYGSKSLKKWSTHE